MTQNIPAPLQALVLAGGRSRRLGGVPKAGLTVEGQTLLARTVDAAARVLAACQGPASQTAPHQITAEGGGAAEAVIAVVGPVEQIAGWLESARHVNQVTAVQEDPPFSGPAMGIAAGAGALTGRDGHVLVLACDMPRAGEVAALLAAELAQCAPGQGVMAVVEGRAQPLSAIYPLAALRQTAEEARAAHRLENASVFSLVANVNIKDIAVPSGLTADIDTWADARALGIAPEPADAEG